MAKYVKGLFKDTSHVDQPEGTWRYAKNLTIHPITGALSNESGFDVVKLPVENANVDEFDVYNILPPAAIVVGAIEITDDRIILFIVYDRLTSFLENLTDVNTSALFSVEYGTAVSPIYNGEIGILEREVYTTLYRPRVTPTDTDIEQLGGAETRLDLNFNREYFIEGTYKINPDGELFVYWTDDLNPPRALNITRQQLWLAENAIATPTERLYGIDPVGSPNLHHREMLNLFPSSGPIPHVELNDIKPGGGLLTGVYYLCLAYVDQDLVRTNYLVISNPISIVEDVEGVLPIERYDGARAKTPTGKAISWSVTNLNTDYEYVRPAIIRHMDGQKMVFGLNDMPVANLIQGGRNIITYTGLESVSTMSVNDIIVDVASYETAKTINQLDGVLYLGNVKGSKDLGYQKYANFIKSHPVVHHFPNFDPREYTLDVLEHGYIETSPYGTPDTIKQGYRHAENIAKLKGYMRDEVYSFYIAFILNDGTESYAYHIPGREQLQIHEDVLPDLPAWNVGSGDQWFQQDGFTTGTDIENLFYWNNMCEGGSQCMETQNALQYAMREMANDAGRMFHFYETSMIRQNNDPASRGARNMNFWQNQTEFYPADDINAANWEIWDAELQGLAERNTEEWGTGVAPGPNGFIDGGYDTNNLAGQRVRHHHFPSNENWDFKTILGTSEDMTVTIAPYKREWLTIDYTWCTNQSFFGEFAEWNGQSIEMALKTGPQGSFVSVPMETDADLSELDDEDAYLEVDIQDQDCNGFVDDEGVDVIPATPIDYTYGPGVDLTEWNGGIFMDGSTFCDTAGFLESLGAEPGEKFFMFSRLGANRDGSGIVTYPKIGQGIEIVWVKHGDWYGNYGYTWEPGPDGTPVMADSDYGPSLYNNKDYKRIAGTYSPTLMYGSDIPGEDLKIKCVDALNPLPNPRTYLPYSQCCKYGEYYIENNGGNAFGIKIPEDCMDESYTIGSASMGEIGVASVEPNWGSFWGSGGDDGGGVFGEASGNWYFPLGCVRKPDWIPISEDALPVPLWSFGNMGCFSSRSSPRRLQKQNMQSAMNSFYTQDKCSNKRDCTVVFAEQGFVIVHCENTTVAAGPSASANFPDIGNASIIGGVTVGVTNASAIVGWIAWAEGHNEIRGTISHHIQALGIQFEDIKVPPEVWEKTQGFRIYYAKRKHEEKRIIGQNLVNPYAPTWDTAYPACSAATSLSGNIAVSGYATMMGQNQDRMWVNWPYALPSYAYPSIRYHEASGGEGFKREYQAFSFLDFYLMRSRASLSSATHIKVEYAVEMLPVTGPGFRHNCWYETPEDCLEQNNDPDSIWFGMALGSTNLPGGGCQPQPPGTMDCGSMCVNPNIINSMLIGFNYYSPNQSTGVTGNGGGTSWQSMYDWLIGIDGSGAWRRTSDLNRALKERCKTYVRGNSIYNGRQLGFGYKTYNDFGESHASFLLHEDNTLRAFHPERAFGSAFDVDYLDSDMAYPPWIRIDTEPDAPFQAVDLDSPPENKPYYYLTNLHAFRLDMYNSLDTQSLVWTGYEVVGEEYKRFWVDDTGAPVINNSQGSALMSAAAAAGNTDPDGDPWNYNDLGNGVDTQNGDIVSKFKTGHVFGGDTFVCRYAWRKHLRPNLQPTYNIVGAAGGTNPDETFVGTTEDGEGITIGSLGHDTRMLYDIIVESPDNINFRHMEAKPTTYYPGAPAKDILFIDNETDLTALDKMPYNTDYSAQNDVGHTVPLPLQIPQPSNFPTRVIRSTKADDSTLIDAFRIFLVADFKDLPKNRGELWKISVFNNLLYLHMQDTLFKTQGKQTMKLGDGTEAFVGSGNIFAQDPDELVQTKDGYGGLQSQWATCVTKFGYFCLDQRSRRVFMVTDSITDLLSLGLEKWLQSNIAYDLEYFGKKNFVDNPLVFGFTAVWDEEFQRILLTKRELSPSAAFVAAWRSWQNGEVNDDYGAIRYNPEIDEFEWSEDGNITASNAWEVIPVTNQLASGFKGVAWFETNGWTVSYYPKLNIWVSFHDYFPYRYLTTSTALYSLRAYTPGISSDATGSNTNEYLDEIHWLNRLIFRHNSVYNKATYYGTILPASDDGHDYGHHKRPWYNTQVEVIHNQGRDMSKLFYNFSFYTDIFQQDYTSYESENDYMDNLLTIKLDTPGIASFILYNSYQCSGQIGVEELVNTRRNGKEWFINKFRDHTSGASSLVSGGGNSSAYYDLYFYDQGNPITPGGVATPAAVSRDNSRGIWYARGMDETLAASTSFSTPGKKFVDKWLGIRLIISNNQNNLVNLYSTDVAIRKFQRQ